MSENKFTEGLLRVGTAGSSVGVNYSVLAKKKGGWVNILHGNQKHTTETRATCEEAAANARLFVTARELLSLLVESQTSIGGDWRERRDAAIRKATGEQP